MWTAIVDWVKGLFGRKGAMQIQAGKENKAVAGTITESSGTAVVGDNNVVDNRVINITASARENSGRSRTDYCRD